MLTKKIALWAFATALTIGLIGAAGPVQQLQAQTYSLPNVNTGCPSNCRQITWQAGSDIWNAGTLPSYTSVTCTGLAGNGTTDDGPAIQKCINALSSGQCAYVPAGTYLINSAVRVRSNTCLRGAKAEGAPPYLPTADPAATTFVTGSSWFLTTQNFSYGAGNLYPPQAYAAFPTTYCYLSGAPQKGTTSLTVASGNPSGCAISVGTWIEVYGNDDPTLITATGTDGYCQWCGNASGFYLQEQIVQVTAVSGSTITISRPLYYPPQTASETVPGSGGNGTVTEPAGAKYTVITPSTTQAGFENLRINGSTADIGSTQLILLQGCFECWVKNVETYKTGSSSGSAHVEMDWGYGDEVRDSAFHDQRSGASGSGYGTYFQFVNSDSKVEDNVYFHNRHSIVYQGGGSGTAVLYNFLDDMMTDDCTYLGSARTSHGAHPYFNLFEGNIISHITADDYWGSSSHDVFFRNWIWGGDSNTAWPIGNITAAGATQTANLSGCSPYQFPPSEGYDAVDVWTGQPYYSFVDNVLGTSILYSLGGTNALWTTATLSESCTQNNCGYDPPSAPGVYSYGVGNTLGGANVASSASTIIRQGNYDFKSLGVAFNDGGTGMTYQSSYYYSLKPTFLGSCPWPEQGSDLSPVDTLSQPAYQRAMGLAACSGGTSTGPASPVSVTTSVSTTTSTTGAASSATKAVGTPAGTTSTPSTTKPATPTSK
jgi:hypothetical protein